MQRIRQIAASGIDGIYVDIPYWMTHFTGWEDSWASFDDNTVAAFRRETGLDARKGLKIGDFADGLKAGEIATPRTQRDIEIKLDAQSGSQLHILPFLGTESVVSSKPDGNGVRFTLPAVERGAVAWID
jgi:hypothetical protein